MEEDKKAYEALLAQITAFEALSREDKKQVMLNENLDMTKSLQIMEQVVESAQRRGFTGELVNVMQQFLLIPDDSTYGTYVLDTYGKILSNLNHHAKNYDAALEWQPDMSMLRKYHEKKKQADQRYQQLSDIDEVISKQRARINKLENELLASAKAKDTPETKTKRNQR